LLPETETAAGEDFQLWALALSTTKRTSLFGTQESTNLRDVDGPSPIRHANPDRRTHTRAVPHRKNIHELPLAAAAPQ
jgi:hypothetical protein